MEAPENKYFDLLQRVGVDHRYQKLQLFIMSISFCISGALMYGIVFLTYVPAFKCGGDFSDEDCKSFVCSLPIRERQQYIPSTAIRINNIANIQNDDYHCGYGASQMQFATTIFFIGSVVGDAISPLLTDNCGRKLSFLIALTLTFVGLLITSFAKSLIMVQIGLLILGIGCDYMSTVPLYFTSQTVINSNRQKYSIILQFFFPCGGLLSAIVFYAFNSYKIVFLLCYAVPCVFCIFTVFFFIIDTPQFLIKLRSAPKIVEDLRYVCQFNGVSTENNQSLDVNYIIKLKQEYQIELKESQKVAFTPIDLFSFPSLRKITIVFILVNVNSYFMFYAPMVVIQSFDISIYLSTIIVMLAQMITFPITYIFINEIPRKKGSMICWLVSSLTSFVMIFLPKSSISILCMLGLFKCAIGFGFQFLTLYTAELYPVMILGMGLGFTAAMGSAGSSFAPMVVGFMDKKQIPVMALFVLLGLLNTGLFVFLRETHGKQPRQVIEEIEEKANEKIKAFEKQGYLQLKEQG